MPLISVITVTYNAAKELPATLESLAAQTFSDFEHLIIDGASSDDTLAIARKMSPKARIVSEPDKGLYDAMNKGLRTAKGDYILFLNAGDAFHAPDSLQAYADAAGPDVDIIYGDTIVVDNQRRVLRPRHLDAPDILTKESFSHGSAIRLSSADDPSPRNSTRHGDSPPTMTGQYVLSKQHAPAIAATSTASQSTSSTPEPQPRTIALPWARDSKSCAFITASPRPYCAI